MKRLSPSEIPGLSPKAKSLVTAGIYSMYTVRHGEASFLLITDNGERFFLDVNGGVLPCGYSDPNLRSIVGDVVILEDRTPEFAVINLC
jgi:hypothetical protein